MKQQVVFYITNDSRVINDVENAEECASFKKEGDFYNYLIGSGDTIDEAWEDAISRDEFINSVQAG